jgi:acyl-coenzyme A thioesterase PaaI-like protein
MGADEPTPSADPARPGPAGDEVADLTQHPQLERFLAAMRGEGFAVGELLPYHQPGCYGCGPDNAAGLHLSCHAGAGDTVTATYTFTASHEGAPGVVHGGAIAAVLDDLFGGLLIRILQLAVTTELIVRYRRAVHVGDPCELTAELLDREGDDLLLAATLRQHGEVKVRADGRFRIIGLERLATRYERVD